MIPPLGTLALFGSYVIEVAEPVKFICVCEEASDKL
jgi:hypothetical protein